MRKKISRNKKNAAVEPPSLYPKWLKSHHLLFFTFMIMLLFGAVTKYLGQL